MIVVATKQEIKVTAAYTAIYTATQHTPGSVSYKIGLTFQA